MTTLSKKASQHRNDGRRRRGKRPKNGHDAVPIQRAQAYLDISAGVMIRFVDRVLSKEPTEGAARGFFDYLKEYAIERGKRKSKLDAEA